MLIFRSQQHPFTQDIYALAKWFHHRQAFYLLHIFLAIASMGSLIESPFKIPIPIGDRWIALRYFQGRTLSYVVKNPPSSGTWIPKPGGLKLLFSISLKTSFVAVIVFLLTLLLQLLFLAATNDHHFLDYLTCTGEKKRNYKIPLHLLLQSQQKFCYLHWYSDFL